MPVVVLPPAESVAWPQACHLEAMRSEAARRERLLTERDQQCAAAVARAEVAEARALASERALSVEIRKLEGDQHESTRLLREFSRAHELKSEHLLGMQQATSRSSSLLAQLQEQAASMAKRLAAQQRKTMRLQESQHLIDATAKSWAQERKALLLAAARSDQAAREASTRLQALEAQHAGLVNEVDQERRGSVHALRQTREVSAASEASLRVELRALQTLRDSLLSDACKVTLKSGSVCSVGQYVKALSERQLRAQRGGGGRAATAAETGEPMMMAPPYHRHLAAGQPPADIEAEAALPTGMPSRVLIGGGGGVSGSSAFNS